MNPILPSRSARTLVFLALSMVCLLLFAGAALAAGPALDTAAGGTFLQANFMLHLVADRARMIQVTLVVVATGCALIWWYR